MTSQSELRSVAGQGKKNQPLQTLNRTLYSLVLLSFLLPFATVRGCSTGDVRTYSGFELVGGDIGPLLGGVRAGRARRTAKVIP
jgi:hypothetical protein